MSNEARISAAQAPFIPVLTVAGSDSGGGAGVQADLKAFFALGVHGMSVITAVTAQNTRGVSRWEAVSEVLLLAQLHAITSDLPPRAVKTGMLPGAAHIAALAEPLAELAAPLVVDPVLVASSGDRLSADDSIVAFLEKLLPVATLVTPNIPEAEALTGMTINSPESLRSAAKRLLETGCGAVLIKGGHGSGDSVNDLLVSPAGTRSFRHPRLEGVFHGTGCMLSAAVAARLARGHDLSGAVELAIEFVGRAMASAVRAGGGSLQILRPGPQP